MRSASRRCALAVVLAALLFTTAACSMLSPNKLPTVRAGVSADYDLTLQFASVLNLPAGADVLMNGVRVGTVKTISERGQGVNVVVGLAGSAHVPDGSGAIIRQNTVLGDTYVALTPPQQSGGVGGDLRNGEVIPLSRTTSPPTLEDTMAVLAYFVNGGSIQRAQQTMATLNNTLPQLNDVRRLSTVVSKDLRDLGGQTQELDRFMDGLNRTSVTLRSLAPQMEGVFSAEAAYYWDRVTTSVVDYISTLLPSVGSIFIGGVWLVPMLRSAAASVSSGRAVYDGAVDASTEVSNFLQSTLVPFAQNPSVNVTSVSTSNGKQLVGDATNLLRMLGAVR